MPASDNFFHAIRYVGQNANFFECIFPLKDEEMLSAMWLLVEPLGSVLQDALRPRYILLTEIQSLAEVIDVLNSEVSFVDYNLLIADYLRYSSDLILFW